MQLEPTDALLRICPLQAIANTYGCVARREVKRRRIDVETKSIVNIAPNDASDLQHIHTQAGAWSQSLLGNSEFARQLGYNHSRIMNERYALNARYRRGFLISPVTPWRNTEMLAAGVSSVLDLAQTCITIALLSLDTNADGSAYESTVPPAPTSGVPADRRLLSHHHGPHNSRATGPRMRHVSRMMLQLNAPAPAPDTTREIAATTREITSIRDDANVARAVCMAGSTPVCQMRIDSRELTAAMFCLAEIDLVEALRPVVTAQLRQASHNDAVAGIRITSIHRPQFEALCRPLPNASSSSGDGSARRLLQQNAGTRRTHLRIVEIYAAVTSLGMFIDLIVSKKSAANTADGSEEQVATPCVGVADLDGKIACILAWMDQNLDKRVFLHELVIMDNATQQPKLFPPGHPLLTCNLVDTNAAVDQCFTAFLIDISSPKEKPIFYIDSSTPLRSSIIGIFAVGSGIAALAGGGYVVYYMGFVRRTRNGVDTPGALGYAQADMGGVWCEQGGGLCGTTERA